MQGVSAHKQADYGLKKGPEQGLCMTVVTEHELLGMCRSKGKIRTLGQNYNPKAKLES